LRRVLSLRTKTCHSTCHSRGERIEGNRGLSDHEHLAFRQADLQLGHLPTEGLPDQSRVVVHHVALRGVGDPTEDVLARTVPQAERDERSAQVVLATLAKAQPLQVRMKLLQHVVGAAVIY